LPDWQEPKWFAVRLVPQANAIQHAHRQKLAPGTGGTAVILTSAKGSFAYQRVVTRGASEFPHLEVVAVQPCGQDAVVRAKSEGLSNRPACTAKHQLARSGIPEA